MIEGASEAVSSVRARLDKLKQGRAVYFAAKGTMVEVVDRVFERGGLTDGGKLQYDPPYELYAYTPPAPRKVSGKGKPFAQWKDQERAKAIQKKQGGNARKIKGGFYQSYLDFKKDMGREDLPFELTGRLRKAYLSSNDAPSSLTESNEGLEAAITLRGDEAKKYEGLSDTKGLFLQFSKEEVANYQRRLFELFTE